MPQRHEISNYLNYLSREELKSTPSTLPLKVTPLHAAGKGDVHAMTLMSKHNTRSDLGSKTSAQRWAWMTLLRV